MARLQLINPSLMQIDQRLRCAGQQALACAACNFTAMAVESKTSHSAVQIPFLHCVKQTSAIMFPGILSAKLFRTKALTIRAAMPVMLMKLSHAITSTSAFCALRPCSLAGWNYLPYLSILMAHVMIYKWIRLNVYFYVQINIELCGLRWFKNKNRLVAKTKLVYLKLELLAAWMRLCWHI